MTTQRHLVALAYSRGADISIFDTPLDHESRAALEWLCRWLIRQGHLAAFAIEAKAAGSDLAGTMGAIEARLGERLVQANLAGGRPPDEPMPAFLAPVWAFDHEIQGVAASTAQFLGLDLEVLAPPSPEEDAGASIPGLVGPRHVYARPFCSGNFAHEAPPTTP